MFVRYQSNSILQLLYPCTRYSPNKCMVCGGSYPDHLELWWSKHLYSPFDQYLDKIYNDALTINEDASTQHHHQKESIANSGNRTNRNRIDRNKTSRNRNRNSRSSLKNSSRSTVTQSTTDPPSFGFHRRYVEDISDIIRSVKDPKELHKLIKKRLTTLQSARIFQISTNARSGVSYIAPAIGFTDNRLYTSKDAFIDFFTIFALASVDNMIVDQNTEFEEKKRRNSRVSNRL